MFKNHNELIEATLEGGNMPEMTEDAKAKAKRAVMLMTEGFKQFSSGYSKMSQGFFMAKGTGIIDAAGGTYMRKALERAKGAEGDADVAVDRFQELLQRHHGVKVEAQASTSMYSSWLLKVHDAISEAYPNLSQWETTPAEKATTQALRKVLVTVKRALGK